MSIFRLFLNAQGLTSNLSYKIFGYVFLACAGLGAIFLLFQTLVPLIGYLESGTLACAALGIVGGGLLLIDKKQQVSTPEEMINKLMTSLKGLDIDSTLKNNVVPLSLVLFGVGVALSQIKNVKNLSKIYKFLK
jgi:hypothetical protein